MKESALTKKWHINLYGPRLDDPDGFVVGPLGWSDGVLSIKSTARNAEQIANHIVKVHNASLRMKRKPRTKKGSK